MSLASDILAPAAVTSLTAAAPVAPSSQAVNSAGFADALTQAQIQSAPETPQNTPLPVAPTLPETDIAPQLIGADTIIAQRQSFIPVHGMADFPATANIDARPLLAVPAPVVPDADILPEAVQPQPVQDEAPKLAAAVALPKPAAVKTPEKPLTEGDSETDDADTPDASIPAQVGLVAVPVLQLQANAAAPHVADPEIHPVAPAVPAPRAKVALPEGDLPQPEPERIEAGQTTPVLAPPVKAEGDLRSAFAGLERLDDKPAVPEPSPQSAPPAPADLNAPPADTSATTDPVQETVDPLTDHAPDLGSQVVTTPDATAPATQTSAPVIMVQVAPLATPSAPVHPALRLDQPDWPEKLAVRLAGAFSANDANIEMQLSPEHLGPLHIRLEMKSGVAQVFVTTTTHLAAEVFARAEPQLSALLAASEVSLSGQQTASGGFAGQGGEPGGSGGQRGFQGQPHRFVQPDTSRAAAAPEASAERLLNLIA